MTETADSERYGNGCCTGRCLQDVAPQVIHFKSGYWESLTAEHLSMRFIAVLILPILGACASPQDRAEDMAAYITANYGLVCDRLGYTPATDEHRNCMVSMYNADSVRNGQILRPLGRRW